MLSHAITDAILGATALGDIGMCTFPTPTWSGGKAATAWSFCATRSNLPKARGYHIMNVDSTVILERPKLKDYRLAIREKTGRDPAR